MAAYYNEIDQFAAAWLRELISNKLISDGDVDERSIEDVHPDDLRGYTQCHFFAGIGGWSYALRLAGWPDDRPVWTGSCPCQPFSTAGKGNGFADERHLWPAFHHLIRERRPVFVLGEQVASGPAGAWIDLVSADLEGLGYACGAAHIPACGVGAPHIRQRMYWVAYADSQRRAGEYSLLRKEEAKRRAGNFSEATRGSETLQMANVHSERSQGRSGGWSGSGERTFGESGLGLQGKPSPTNGRWRDADWLLCRDDKWRPVEPGTFPLAHGPSARVGRLRGYGNAIVPQAAQAFIEAVVGVVTDAK